MLGIVVAFGLALAALPSGCSSDETTGGPGGAATTGATGVGGGGSDGCATSELCNGIDDDCDGQTDEDCACIDGDTQPCFSGTTDQQGVGICMDGTQTCDDTGTWGACQGEVVAEPMETCNGADDDCNGAADDGFGSVTCGVGLCQVTVDECVDGTFMPCLPGMPSPTEACDGFDDDCDGTIDNGCSCTDGEMTSCYSGTMATQNVGECKNGTATCVNGQYGSCQGDITPTTEICDNKDNDCDGQVDDGNPGGGPNCNTMLLGVCIAGTLNCVSGSLACQQNVMPSAEQCNGLDDDCDGMTDEGNPGGGANCSTGQQGVCSAGTLTCASAMLQCVPNMMAGPEICNSLDDDCDGVVDDGNPGGGSPCSTGQQGICSAGTQVCSAGMLQCQQNQMAQPSETCNNGLDDDCNGQIDDGCAGNCGPTTQNCDGSMTNGCECAGTGCCGMSCQTQHDNGQGQFFYDCVALSTFNSAQALKACAAFTGDPVDCVDYGNVCNGTSVVCGDPNGGADCACWGYAGPAVGYVYNHTNNQCLCPLVGDPTWN